MNIIIIIGGRSFCEVGLATNTSTTYAYLVKATWPRIINTVIYQLIAMATTTFTK